VFSGDFKCFSVKINGMYMNNLVYWEKQVSSKVLRLLGCNAVSLGEWFLIFRTIIGPSPSRMLEC
jgi:hypothetical protein